MSKKEFERFAQALDSDASLDQELTDFVGKANAESVFGRIAEFAQAHGFDVEAADARRAQIDTMELSEDELDLVAGGASALMMCKGGTGKCTCDGTTWCPWSVFCATVHYHGSERSAKEWNKILDDKTLEDPDD